MTKTLGEVRELPALAREVAILVTAAHAKAAYAFYAHSAVSALPKPDLDQIWQGECPAHLDSASQTAFHVAYDLCHQPGPLRQSVWEQAVETLGRKAAVALVHYVGFYKYVATILNGFDAKVPDS